MEPDVDWEPLRPFWAAAARGELALPRCPSCRRWVWYPRPCCGGDKLSFETLSGRGTVFSFAVPRRALAPAYADWIPFATGIVSLAEDPSLRLVTRFVDCAPEELRIDLPVRAVYRPLASGVLAPHFAPAV